MKSTAAQVKNVTFSGTVERKPYAKPGLSPIPLDVAREMILKHESPDGPEVPRILELIERLKTR